MVESTAVNSIHMYLKLLFLRVCTSCAAFRVSGGVARPSASVSGLYRSESFTI